ncbi:MAG: GvpL/GvpF family gas vesicle protein [Planctomycetes bacterium]|nr:GvpL/GvpF family gas vesicle protein [Planctomycetota bacterium]MBU4399137.1 GvpL/GvpF family gas vesicle protein [Planctomycetota bacterium]MCG2683654.1 GvpL/GvpF family gas vesicle protein [Planctomycetales bacterium]
MSDLHYCQYAFARPECRVKEIGRGVDPHYNVELVREGPIAAVISRVSLDRFSPARLQGKTAEDIQWLGEVAARYNEIICQAASGSAVLPLRLGTLFRSLDSLRATLVRCRSTVAEFLQQLGDRQEWGVKLYLAKLRMEAMPGHKGLPPPHYLNQPQTGTAYLTRKKAQLDGRRELRAAAYRSIQTVEQRLTGIAEHCCRIRNLSGELTGRSEEMVFNAAYLLSSSGKDEWLNALDDISRDIHDKGLLLEVSGPWPPYHFCPKLEL